MNSKEEKDPENLITSQNETQKDEHEEIQEIPQEVNSAIIKKKDFLTKNFINNFLLEMKNNDESLKKKLLKLDENQESCEASRISLLKYIKNFKNSENDIFQNISSEIKNITDLQDDSSNINHKVISKLFENQKNLKNKIVSIFMHMDDRIIDLKTEKDHLSKELGIKENSINSLNQKKYIKTLEKEIFKLQKIIKHKEKVIIREKFQKIHKNQFIQLQNLKHETKIVEIGNILRYYQNELKNKNGEFRKMIDIVNSSQNEFKSIQNFSEYDKICKSFLKQSHFSIPIDSYQYDCSNNSYIVKGKSFNKNSSEYKKKVIFQTKMIKKKNKEINRLNEKIMNFNDSILGMQIEIKMYRKMENKNQSYMKNIKNMIDLQEDKIKYSEKEIADAKKKIFKLKNEVKTIVEEIKIGYLKNVQKLKCYNYIVRKYIRSTIENNSDLKRFISEIKHNFKTIPLINERTIQLIDKYRDLQLINNTLRKKYIPKVKDKICEKKVVKKKNKKKINSKLTLPEIKMDVNNLQNDVKCKMEELRNVLKEKSKSMKEIGIIIDEIKDIKNLMEKEMSSRDELKTEIKKKNKDIVGLEKKIDKISSKMSENEIKLEKMKNDNTIKTEDIVILEKKLIKQKQNIKVLKKSKKDINKIVIDKENTITKKEKKIDKLVVKLEKVNKKNIELKKNFENQFKKIQEICEESFEKYKLLEDLMKKEKIFNQLYKLQCNKIIIRDKKIYDLKHKFEEQQNLIEILMTKKLTNTNSKNDQEKISFLNLPNEIKKNFKINKSLSKKIKSVEARNDKLKLIIESWEKKYNKLLQRFEKLRYKYNESYDNELKENLDTIDTLKRTVLQYEKVFEEMKKKKNNNNDETEKFEQFLDNLQTNNEFSEIDEFGSSIEKNFEGVLNSNKNEGRKKVIKNKSILIDKIKFDKLQKFFFNFFISYEDKLKNLKLKMKKIKLIFGKQIIINDLIKKEYNLDLKKLKKEDITLKMMKLIKKKEENSQKEKDNIENLKKVHKEATKNLTHLIQSFETSEIFLEIDPKEIKIEKIKKFINNSKNLEENIKKKKMVILELRSQVNEAWDEIKEKEEKISEIEEQNFNMLQLNEENENKKNLEKKKMKTDLNDLKELVKELKGKNGENKLVEDLLIKIENQEKGIMELKNDIQKKVVRIASLQKTLTKNRLSSNNSSIQKNKINSKYYSFNDNSDLSYSEMSSIQIQVKKQNNFGQMENNDFESDNSSLFLKNQERNEDGKKYNDEKNGEFCEGSKNEFILKNGESHYEKKNEDFFNKKKNFGEIQELEEEIELSENNSIQFEKKNNNLRECEEFEDFFVDDDSKDEQNSQSFEGKNIFDVSEDKSIIKNNTGMFSFKI